MKLFSTRQIEAIDKYTIKNEPVSNLDLMERAAMQVTMWLEKKFHPSRRLIFFAGPGNNGGDALAVARQMAERNYQCEVYLLDLGKQLKGPPKTNWQRLEKQGKAKRYKMKNPEDFPETEETDIIIDGIFGSGLSRPLDRFVADVVKKINELENTVVAIDIPSGLMGEDNAENEPENIVQADFTLTFQFPKLSFLFHENEIYTGKWKVLPIGLHPAAMAREKTEMFILEREDVRKLIPQRSKFAHKGTFGHALLIAGSSGKIGAAVLASKSCLRSGVGLLTTHIPRTGYPIIQAAVPEAMVSVDQHDSVFTEFPDLTPFSAIGIGPGIDKKQNTRRAFRELIEEANVPLVIDADGLNILSENKEWLEKLPENSILTPHPGEFTRLTDESLDSYEQLQKQIRFAKSYKVIVVLKGAFTSIATPEGLVYFNPTGNPGMATGGSGDALTGIILGLLAQGLSPEDASLVGVYLHGMAADLAVEKSSEYSLVAGDIIQYLGQAFHECLKPADNGSSNISYSGNNWR